MKMNKTHNNRPIFHNKQYYTLTEILRTLPLPTELKLTVVLHFLKKLDGQANFNKIKFWLNCFTDIEQETELPALRPARYNTVAMKGENGGNQRSSTENSTGKSI